MYRIYAIPVFILFVFIFCLSATQPESDSMCPDLTSSARIIQPQLMALDSLCETPTFIKTYGVNGVVERGHIIIPSNDGNLYIGGNRDSRTLLIKSDTNGNFIWSRSFQFSSSDDVITDLIIDSAGFLLGCGFSPPFNSNLTGFAFKYDAAADVVVWVQQINQPGRAVNIIETSTTDDYIIIGDRRSSPFPGNGEDGVMYRLDRNTGQLTGALERHYHHGSSETFASSILFNNEIYTTGRYTNGGGPENMRVGFTKFDLNGNEVYTKLSHVPLNNTARLYSNDLVAANNEIFVISSGDDDGTLIPGTNFFISNYSLNGNLNWVKKYNAQGLINEGSNELIALSDGLLAFCADRRGDENYILVKTDFNGTVIWAKKYGGIGFNNASTVTQHQILATENKLFLAGSTSAFGSGDTDILLMKLNIDGTLTENCNLVSDIIIDELLVLNPVNVDVSLTNYPAPLGWSTATTSVDTAILPGHDICIIECVEICNNGLDDDGDGLVDCADDIDCPLMDLAIIDIELSCSAGRVISSLMICNLGNAEAGPVINLGIYDGNPTFDTSAIALETILLDTLVEPDSCLLIEVELNTATSNYTFIINDDTSLLPIFDLAIDFPSTDSIECNYLNNLFERELLVSSPPLDLGPDTSICLESEIILEVNLAWDSVLWQDDNTNYSYTVSAAGIYHVQVVDICGRYFFDTIEVFNFPKTRLDLGEDTIVCSGQNVLINAQGLNNYLWLPQTAVPCSTCPENTITVDTPLCLVVVADDENGCITADTIKIDVTNDTIFNSSYYTICAGDSIEIFGIFYNQADTFSVLRDSFSCTRLDSIFIQSQSTQLTYDTIYSCSNSTEVIFGDTIFLPGSYSRIFPSSNGCDSVHTITWIWSNEIDLSITPEARVCLGDSIMIEAITADDLLTYSWNPPVGLSCADCLQPTAFPTVTTLYELRVSDTAGCTDSHFTTVYVESFKSIFIPSAFSPNNDGINDRLVVYGSKDVLLVREFSIYNRWGGKVFESVNFPPNDKTFGWNGTNNDQVLDNQIFVYNVIVEFVDGTQRNLQGNIMLIR